jgi:hypothetical protein
VIGGNGRGDMTPYALHQRLSTRGRGPITPRG